MKIHVVSPSGQFYGSEQVLYNFLEGTAKSYKVYVPKNSIFHKKLKQLGQHQILGFKSVQRLYLQLYWQLLVGNCKTLYVNEGGHIKYVKLLARCFPKKQFFVHIRLLEDCQPERLGQIPKNLQLISISQYISSELQPYKAHLIHDPLNISGIQARNTFKARKSYNIGVIGRVSPSKGLRYYKEFFSFIQSKPGAQQFEFLFFGDIHSELPEVQEFYELCESCELSISFNGFVSNQSQIYDTIDMVLHLNPNEPLGRIGLESWARGIPFIGFDSGGVGEINSLLELLNFCVTTEQDWSKELWSKLGAMEDMVTPDLLEQAQLNVARYFGVSRYVSALEALFKIEDN